MYNHYLYRIFTLVLVFASFALSAQSTYYVSPSGSDDATGSSLANAWQTIEYGLATIAPGDTLLVADGLYVETDLVIDQQSTEDKPTVVKSINQWGAKLESNRQYATVLRTEGARHVVIDGFEVFNPEDRPFEDWNTGINIYRSNFVTVQNCYVHDCGCGGIGGRESDYMTIRRNVTRDNAKTNPYNCSGISIYQPTQLDDEPGTHILIAENVCFENECRLPFTPLGFTTPTDGNGIILDDFNWTQSLGDGPQQEPYVAQTIVENNLSFNNGGAGMKAYEVANAIFRNNTSVHNNYVLEEYTSNLGEIAGEFVRGSIEIYNNMIVQGFGQKGHAVHWQPSSPEATFFLKSNIIVGDIGLNRPATEMTDNITVTYDEQSFPRFGQIIPDDFEFSSVDDFRPFFGLRTDSPGIDHADPSLAPTTDLNGNPRPANGPVDAGAFEGPVTAVGPVPSDRVFEQTFTSAVGDINLNGLKDPFFRTPPRAIEREALGTVANEEDLSATWSATYDETYLYFFVDVTDNRLRNNSANPSDDDGVELFIDADNSRGDAYDGVNDFHYIFGYNDQIIIERAMNATQGVIAVQSSSFTGYTKEIAIPWTTLGVSPAEGTEIGLDFWINDDDNDGAIDGRLTWQDRENEAGENPRALGIARLESSEEVATIFGVTDGLNIAVDGEYEEGWWNAETLSLGNLIDGNSDGPEDLSATWRALWNPTFLYLYVSVTDDALRDNSSDYYNDDAIEVYLDFGLECTDEYDANDRQLSVAWNSNSVSVEQGTVGQGAFTTVKNTDVGYDVEIRLPWASVGFTPAEGKYFGLDVHVTDDDNVSSRDAKHAWFATADESEENPSTFGIVRLGEAAPTAVFNSVVAETLQVVPNPTSGMVRLEMPATPETVTVTDLRGRVVVSDKAVRMLDLSELAAGTYIITAVIDGGIWRGTVVR